jgi:hypothetical protein
MLVCRRCRRVAERRASRGPRSESCLRALAGAQAELRAALRPAGLPAPLPARLRIVVRLAAWRCRRLRSPARLWEDGWADARQPDPASAQARRGRLSEAPDPADVSALRLGLREPMNDSIARIE